MKAGDQLRCRPRTKAVELRIVVGREELDDFHSVLTVGNECELAGADHPDLQIMHIVELAIGGEHLIEFGVLRAFDIDDAHAFIPC